MGLWLAWIEAVGCMYFNEVAVTAEDLQMGGPIKGRGFINLKKKTAFKTK